MYLTTNERNAGLVATVVLRTCFYALLAVYGFGLLMPLYLMIHTH